MTNSLLLPFLLFVPAIGAALGAFVPSAGGAELGAAREPGDARHCGDSWSRVLPAAIAAGLPSRDVPGGIAGLRVQPSDGCDRAVAGDPDGVPPATGHRVQLRVGQRAAAGIL